MSVFWIIGIILLAVALLCLCICIFNNGCLPFNQTRDEDILPTTLVNLVPSVPQHSTWIPADIGRYPQSYLPTSINDGLPTTEYFIAPLPTPQSSPWIALKFGDKKLRSIISKQNRMPTIDLHGMTVTEAIASFEGFLQRQKAMKTPVTQVITGRGVHSDGEAKIKPAINDILLAEGLHFNEINKGGAYRIFLQ